MKIDYQTNPREARLIHEIFEVIDIDSGHPITEALGPIIFADDEVGVVLNYKSFYDDPNIRPHVLRADPATGNPILQAHRANIKFVPRKLLKCESQSVPA